MCVCVLRLSLVCFSWNKQQATANRVLQTYKYSVAENLSELQFLEQNLTVFREVMKLADIYDVLEPESVHKNLSPITEIIFRERSCSFWVNKTPITVERNRAFDLDQVFGPTGHKWT